MVKVIWRKRALSQLNHQYNHIKKDSLSSVKKVRDTILDMTDALKDHPEIHPLDKYFKDNKGNVRAFEKYSFTGCLSDYRYGN